MDWGKTLFQGYCNETDSSKQNLSPLRLEIIHQFVGFSPKFIKCEKAPTPCKT